MSTIVRPRVGKETLSQVCQNLGIPAPTWRDEWYELVDMQWFDRATNSIYRRVDEDVGEFEEGCSDCDDFASCAWEEVKRLYRRKPGRIKGCAIAFGVTDIITSRASTTSNNPDRGHHLCILFWWNDKAGNDISNIVVGFFEPQECELVSLDKEQYQNSVIYV